MNNKISISNINHNNFKNVSFSLEKNTFIVFTGPSGSGKSTLAIDIIYAESQRKFIESLPLYARQFIGLPEKADIGEAVGLTPAIAIDQKTNSHNSRSTVGTVSEIYEYVRLLYSVVGEQYCWHCLLPVRKMTPALIVEEISKNVLEDILIYIRIDEKNAKELEKQVAQYIAFGYSLFFFKHILRIIRNIEMIKDLGIKNGDLIGVVLYQQSKNYDFGMMTDAIIKGFSYKEQIFVKQGKEILAFADGLKCVHCHRQFAPISQRLFSFNLPTGACVACKGIGTSDQEMKNAVAKDFSLLLDIMKKKTDLFCTSCEGGRLNKNALAVYVDGMTIFQFCQIPLSDYYLHFIRMKNLFLDKKEILDKIFFELEKRVNLLIDLGLGYLHLSRNSNTLSGGELQRIRLASQLGSALTGVTYILDEPSIGLHQRDNIKLIGIMKKLRDLGNTVIVVEHDEETMLAADSLVDIGPGAGVHGGKIVFQGDPKEIFKNEDSITGAYLSGRKQLISSLPKRIAKKYFNASAAKTNNLKGFSVRVPLEIMTVISGVSGSGKSTFIFSELIPQMLKDIQDKDSDFYAKKKLGFSPVNQKDFEAVVVVDQSSLGRTSRSTVGTYLGLFDHIRELFASLPESKMAGYTIGSFSFNTGNERCQKCSGKGELVVNMDPLPSITVDCTACQGKRYGKNILHITYKDKNIYQVLQMTIDEALVFFSLHKKISSHLKALCAVGLGYITLDQSSDTFSGGEAQRVKLAFELYRRKKNTIYVLDEPTTGLHFQDIKLLLSIFDKLIEQGNTLIVIEHNMSVIRYADYVIDMGPEGGDKGGYIVAEGTPYDIKQNKDSITGKYI